MEIKFEDLYKRFFQDVYLFILTCRDLKQKQKIKENIFKNLYFYYFKLYVKGVKI